MSDLCYECAQEDGECLCPKQEIVKTPCPLGKRVMLVKDEAPEETKGGIVIPENAREKPLTARVLGVGHEVTQLSKGDEVIFASFAGTTFTIGDQDIIVVDEEDIMLVLREKPSEENN